MAGKEEFIGESIIPDMSDADASAASPGAPVVPARFTWRGKQYQIAAIINTWKDTGACTHGSGERYVRKHWFEIQTADGITMKIYFERRARSTRDRTKRWWIFSIIT